MVATAILHVGYADVADVADGDAAVGGVVVDGILLSGTVVVVVVVVDFVRLMLNGHSFCCYFHAHDEAQNFHLTDY